MSIYVGEALVGEGNEIAHIDLLLGRKDGPVGTAFSNAIATQTAGHSNLLAVLTPNLAVKPATVMVTKVTIKGAKQAVQMFGPAQTAVANAVNDELVADGFKLVGDPNGLVIVCGVFIHWQAADDQKLLRFNYTATRKALQSAVAGGPKVEDLKAAAAKIGTEIRHPFAGSFDLAEAMQDLRAGFPAKA